jgi:hypothetical protein
MRTHGGYWKGDHPHEARRSDHPVDARGGDGGVREELAAGVGCGLHGRATATATWLAVSCRDNVRALSRDALRAGMIWLRPARKTARSALMWIAGQCLTIEGNGRGMSNELARSFDRLLRIVE